MKGYRDLELPPAEKIEENDPAGESWSQEDSYNRRIRGMMTVLSSDAYNWRFTADELALNGNPTEIDFGILTELVKFSQRDFVASIVCMETIHLTLKRLYANLIEREEEESGLRDALSANKHVELLIPSERNPLTKDAKKPPTQKHVEMFVSTLPEYEEFEHKLRMIKSAKRKVGALIQLTSELVEVIKQMLAVRYENVVQHEVYSIDWQAEVIKIQRELKNAF